MNREQMIAWLTLEGWEPRESTQYKWGTSLIRGKDRITADGAYAENSLYVPYFDVPVDWARVSDYQLEVGCK